MPTFNFQAALDSLAADIPVIGLKRIPLLPFDKYILMSGLQKAIRRGDCKKAASFALSLYHQDRRSLYRRLAVIAFEDVAIAAPEVVTAIVAAVKSPEWRVCVGDAAIAVELAKRMAAAPKTRLLTELLFYCDLHPLADKARQQVTRASNKRLENITLDPDKELYERCLALWGLMGTRKYPAKGFSRPQGDADRVADIIKKLPVPDEIAAVCLTSLTDKQWPLAAFYPLGWLAMQSARKDLRVRDEVPLSTPEFEGLPMYAVDMYTRLGQQCIRQLRNTVQGLKPYSPAQLGEACFFIEAETLTQRLTSDRWDDFRLDSMLALMKDLGLDADEYAALNRMLVKRWDLYNEIRLEQLRRSLYGIEKDLFAAREI